MTVFQKPEPLAEELKRHLTSWGLRRFTDEATYYQWQKEVLAIEELAELNRLGLARGGGVAPEADIRFYDLAARQNILPVLYSQRYDYYLEIGCAITGRIEPAHKVLDFGCGVGILTTFYARHFPHLTFVGIDRSRSSIEAARHEATKRGLSNVRFENLNIPTDFISDSFDLIISTQALFQAEFDPGLPSRNWGTFERADDPALQAKAEARTGLKDRLDYLTHALFPGGRMLLFEKARHLGRRILLQRALTKREYQLVGEPVCFQYSSIDEVVEDGPLYEVSHETTQTLWPWSEEPAIEPGESLYTARGKAAEEFVSSLTNAHSTQTSAPLSTQEESTTVTVGRWEDCLAYRYVKSRLEFRGLIIGSLKDEALIQQYFSGAEGCTEMEHEQVISRFWPRSESLGDESESPGYENHTAVAQAIWECLPSRHVQDQATFQGEDGREIHIELGTSGTLAYLYWANTYDQRQLVMMPAMRAKVLKDYFHESLGEMRNASFEKDRSNRRIN